MTTPFAGKFAMPARLPLDPDPKDTKIFRVGPDHIMIELGNGQSMMLSEYHAARVCGLLSLFLNLRFIPAHAKKLLL